MKNSLLEYTSSILRYQNYPYCDQAAWPPKKFLAKVPKLKSITIGNLFWDLKWEYYVEFYVFDIEVFT